MAMVELDPVTEGPVKGQVFCRKRPWGWPRYVVTSVQVGQVYFTTEDRFRSGKKRATDVMYVGSWRQIAYKPRGSR